MRLLPLLLMGLISTANAQPDLAALQSQVATAERAFARSMVQRDHAAFTALLSEQAVFFGDAEVLRGKAAVSAGWKRFFEGPQAPFSWEPDRVEVLADGQLALSTGPVRDAAGKVIARFNSIWRQEAPGHWRVVFDKGQPPAP
jgi:ketosteroid isomerase-like protein